MQGCRRRHFVSGHSSVSRRAVSIVGDRHFISFIPFTGRCRCFQILSVRVLFASFDQGIFQAVAPVCICSLRGTKTHLLSILSLLSSLLFVFCFYFGAADFWGCFRNSIGNCRITSNWPTYCIHHSKNGEDPIINNTTVVSCVPHWRTATAVTYELMVMPAFAPSTHARCGRHNNDRKKKKNTYMPPLVCLVNPT